MHNLHEHCFAPLHRNMHNLHEHCFAPLHRNLHKLHEHCFAPLHRNMRNSHEHCFAPLHRNMHNLQHISYALFQLMCYSIGNNSVSSGFKSRPRDQLSFSWSSTSLTPRNRPPVRAQPLPSRSLPSHYSLNITRCELLAVPSVTRYIGDYHCDTKTVFWNVTPCRLQKCTNIFGRRCLHLHG